MGSPKNLRQSSLPIPRHLRERRSGTCVSQGLRCGPTSLQQDLPNHVNPHAGFRGEAGV
jgi:hypothetical protein